MEKFMSGECKRCLFDGAASEAYYRHIQKYIENIDSTIKTRLLGTFKNIFLLKQKDYKIYLY